ncbi:hypothetical protein GCM10027347_32680 [Larkinella harenae]
MNNWIDILLAGIAGLVSGVVFYGGLWLTVKKALNNKYASLLFFSSFLLRTAFTLTVFYFAAAGRWERMLVCMAGFLIARLAVIYFTKEKKGAMPAPTNHEHYT